MVTYSLHKIYHAENPGFDPGDYSRFKFGDGLVARAFGNALSKGFIAECLAQRYAASQIVVISSPYSFIPTATFSMKNHFVFTLNRWLADHSFPVVQEAKVHRTITYKEDYGELDAADRLKLIGNDCFHIDKAFLEGKTVIFLDDIKITGSHERMIQKMVQEYQLQNEIFMVYFAELKNSQIHPRVENYYNYFAIKSIFDFENIVKSDSFEINTRFVKYILNCDFEPFSIFLENQTEYFIELLYNMALGNGYHKIESYKKNLNHIKTRFYNQQTKIVPYGN